ncbi:MAG: tRNA lysidine(34) synthetase TilS [Planctomycetia bacterium]|nr:tRNA lysidine(34) synthetase TilS [Planctomycetia bacterium]
MNRLPLALLHWRQTNPGGLVVAVSGGPDSVALLCGLTALSPNLLVAHLNHQLRPEADADASFVADLAASLNVPFVSGSLDIRRLAAGQNLEAVARRERYAWLTSVAQAHRLPLVATGHTAGDQAETVLHRLLRGTGLDGLRGIAARRRLAEGIDLVRPLLTVSRSDILSYLAERNQPARHDATNDQTTLTRNRIRHLLLPLLARDYNPRIEKILAGLAAQAEETFSSIETQATHLLALANPQSASPESNVPSGETRHLLTLDATPLVAAPGFILRAAFRLLWRSQGWPMGEMGADHWRAIESVCRGTAKARDLPGGQRIRRIGGLIRLERLDGNCPPIREEGGSQSGR